MTQRLLKGFSVAVMLLLPALAHAQATVTAADIQRLQDEIYQASADLNRSRSNTTDAARLQDDLDELRDEVIYLKVRLRKEGSVSRNDYMQVRDRVQALRSHTRGEGMTERQPERTAERQGSWSGGTGATTGRTGQSDSRGTRTTQSGSNAIPTGQELDVRLQERLSSDTAQAEDRFEATTVVDLNSGNDVLIPAGSVLRGVVRTVDKATRTDRRGQLTVSFDQITVRGRAYPMRGTVTQALESEGVKGEAARIGAGAGVGAIIGGIIGGVKGALLGVLIGGGGTIAATEGKDVTLEPGTILRVRLETPPAIR